MHTVVAIVDYRTIRISSFWTGKGVTSDLVRIKGFEQFNKEVQLEFGTLVIVQRLQSLLLNQTVTLSSPGNVIIRGALVSESALECEVFLNGVNIINYFPEFKKV